MSGKDCLKKSAIKVTTSGLLPSRNMKPELQVPKVQSAHAILILDGNYILQLRDDKSTIAAAGQWALFGGRINVRETPLQSIKREVYEELSIEPPEYGYLWFTDYFESFEKTVIRTWFFASDVTAAWPGQKLREGEAVRAFEFKQLASLDMPSVMCQTLERFHRQIRGECES